MPIKVGFICGKDTDVVEDPKYTAIGGDASFLADLPDAWRVDPDSKEYLKDCEPGTKGFAHCDVAIPWWIHKNCSDIQVEILGPEDLTKKRLRANDFNFSMGFNAVNLLVANDGKASKVIKALKDCGNIMPTWEVEEYILHKSHYMKACIKAGVPMAPTIFSMKGKRSPEGLLKEIKSRGWKTFVMKQSESGFCLGFLKLKVEDCEKDPSILKTYFKDYKACPEYIVQESIEGFTRNWETRCFWYNGEFLYAIANMAAVSTEDGSERIISGDDIPAEFLENAKRIGKEALKCLPPLKCPTGGEVPMILVRTDIGCSDSQIYDKDFNWDPNGKTFFLNEIEPSSTTYFVRHLKFDCIPLYGKLYAETSRKIAEQMALHTRKKVAPKAKAAMKTVTSMKKPVSGKKTAGKAKGKIGKKVPSKQVAHFFKKAVKAPMKAAAMKAGKASTKATAVKAKRK